MSTNRRVKVLGGYNVTEEKGEGANKRTITTFVTKREVVVEEKDLAALFRRDHELAAMVIYLQTTRERLTPDHQFSQF